MREPGFYWVNREGFGWQVAHWVGNHWYLFGLNGICYDENLIEIDEERLIHTEKALISYDNFDIFINGYAC